jgi:hypothetical protein
MSPKRPKVAPIRNPTLFDMDKLEVARRLARSLNVERPYSEPGLLLSTRAFAASGWAGAFYASGMKQSDFLLTTRPNSRQSKLTAHITERRAHRPSQSRTSAATKILAGVPLICVISSRPHSIFSESCFFWGLRFTLWTPDGQSSVFQLVLENFFLYFAFAANVFFIFRVSSCIGLGPSAKGQAEIGTRARRRDLYQLIPYQRIAHTTKERAPGPLPMAYSSSRRSDISPE